MDSIKSTEITAAEKKKEKAEITFAKKFAKWAGTIYNDIAFQDKEAFDFYIDRTKGVIEKEGLNLELKRSLAEEELFRSSLDIPLITKYVQKIKPQPEAVETTPKNSFDNDFWITYYLYQLFFPKSKEVDLAEKQQNPNNCQSSEKSVSQEDRRQLLKLVK